MNRKWDLDNTKVYELSKKELSNNAFLNKGIKEINFASIGSMESFSDIVKEYFYDIDKNETHLLKLANRSCHLLSQSNSATEAEAYNWFLKFVYSLMLNNPNTKQYKDLKREFIETIIKLSQKENDKGLEVSDTKFFLRRILYIIDWQVNLILDLIIFKVCLPYYPHLNKYLKFKDEDNNDDETSELFGMPCLDMEIENIMLDVFPSFDKTYVLSKILDRYASCFGEKFYSQAKKKYFHNYYLNFNFYESLDNKEMFGKFIFEDENDEDDSDIQYDNENNDNILNDDYNIVEDYKFYSSIKNRKGSYRKKSSSKQTIEKLSSQEVEEGINNIMKLDMQDIILYYLCNKSENCMDLNNNSCPDYSDSESS